MNEEYLKEASYVNMGVYRRKTMEYLRDKEYDIPKNIAKAVNVNLSHVSRTLMELNQHGLVMCINPEAKKGKLYRLTGLGGEVVEYLDII